jgi:hypothetical protein
MRENRSMSAGGRVNSRNRRLARLLCWSLLAVPAACNLIAAGDEAAPTAPTVAPDPNFQVDLKHSVTYLASDELEGRGVGTKGLDLAADYIADTFRKLGLQPVTGEGMEGYFQPFTMATAIKPGPDTMLEWGPPAAAPQVPEGQEVAGNKTEPEAQPAAGGDPAAAAPGLPEGHPPIPAHGGDDAAQAIEPGPITVGEQFVPISFSAEATFEGPAVFVGYGITDAERKYNDYEGIDVKGKVVIAMRYEPHTDDGASQFVQIKPHGDNPHGENPHAKPPGQPPLPLPVVPGQPAPAPPPMSDYSENATLGRKAELAAANGAAALVLVNPPQFHEDELIPFSRTYGGEQSKIPVVQVKSSVVDAWLKAAGHRRDLKTLQVQIDATLKPRSLDLGKSVRVKGKVAVERTEAKIKNVVAVLPGKGERAGEYVVIGAHYDHLGKGGFGSLIPGKEQVHNGADDNASGTSAMLELAEHYAKAGPQERSIVFVAFTAEESGLVGSARFVNHPPLDLGKVAYMLNLDMVGRIRNETLFTGGGGTAPSFEEMLKKADENSPLELQSIGKGGFGPSDHMSFALKKIPVIFLFSGTHPDYHRPTDDADKVNYDGIEKAVKVATEITDAMLKQPREQYVSANDSSGISGVGRQGSKVTLGVVPHYGEGDKGGVKIDGTSAGSPAEAAGLKAGDVIVQFGEMKIETLYDLTDALAKGKPGDKVKLGVIRDGQRIELEATLAARK